MLKLDAASALHLPFGLDAACGSTGVEHVQLLYATRLSVDDLDCQRCFHFA
jgi:hypothetical protein